MILDATILALAIVIALALAVMLARAYWMIAELRREAMIRDEAVREARKSRDHAWNELHDLRKRLVLIKKNCKSAFELLQAEEPE